jgi:hypothetical protein
MKEILEKNVEENILRNLLLHELFISERLWDQQFFDELHEYCIDVIIDIYKTAYDKEIDVNKYYNMNIKYENFGDNVQIVCDNIISSLWFSGVFPPDNLDKIMLLNKFEFNKKLYSFNKKSKKLVITNI